VKWLSQTVRRPWLDKYLEGTELLHIPRVGLYTLLEQTTEAYSSNTAIIFNDEKITYQQLKEQTDRLANAWRQLGAEKGERIGLMVSNHPSYVISYYAAQKLGMIVVQINPMYTRRELSEIFNDSSLSYLVLESRHVSKVSNLYTFKHVFLTDKEENETFEDIEQLIQSSFPDFQAACHIQAETDIAVIQYTGGTTGKKKGAMLTHFNLVANVIQSKALYQDLLQFGEERILTVSPLYHVYGMTAAMNLGIYMGATMLIVPKYEIEEVLRVIKTYKPTFFPGVPKMYNDFVHYPNIETYGLNCFKICSCGSAPLPVEIIKKFEAQTGSTLGEGYGLSETSPTTHRNPPSGIRKIGSIGIPLLGTDCRILDEQGSDLPENTVGELAIKGPQVMRGYWNKEEETKNAFKDEWFLTGDLATMDQDGYFYIVGRKKEMIIVGGFNVYPQEVESVLYEFPDILEAAVVGLHDEDNGEVVKAFVVPKEGKTINLTVLKEHCYQNLTRYKVPKLFEVIDTLPRNSVGKLLKRLLVEHVDTSK
jgi:long-chain acyl-CoA synthetase